MENQINISNNNRQPMMMPRIVVNNILYALANPIEGAPKNETELAREIVARGENEKTIKTIKNRLSRIIQNPELLTLREVDVISKILNVPLYKLTDPNYKDYRNYEPFSRKRIEAFVYKIIQDSNRHKLIWSKYSEKSQDFSNRLNKTEKLYVTKEGFRTKEYLEAQNINCEGLSYHTYYVPKNNVERFQPHMMYMLELNPKTFLYLVDSLEGGWYLIYQWIEDDNGTDEEVICKRDERTSTIPLSLFNQLIDAASSNVSTLSVSSRAVNSMCQFIEKRKNKN